MRFQPFHRPALLGLLCALLFWALGLFSQPHPILLAILLATSLIACIASLLRLRVGKAPLLQGIAAVLIVVVALGLLGFFLGHLFSGSTELRWSDNVGADSANAGADSAIAGADSAIAGADSAIAGAGSAIVGAGSASGRDTRVRILTFNVQHRYPGFRQQEERYIALLEGLRALDLDIIVLQEAWRTNRHGDLVERLANDLGMSSVAVRANGSLRYLGFEEGSAILSRLPIVGAEAIPLSPLNSVWAKRLALAAEVSLGDSSLRLIGTHLALGRGPAVLEQAVLLGREAAARHTHLVLGDLNSTQESDVLRVLQKAGLTPVLAMRIDYILASPRQPEGWSIGESGAALRSLDLELPADLDSISDHPGLFVELLRVPQVLPGQP